MDFDHEEIGGSQRAKTDSAGRLAVDDLDERLRSRVIAASGHATTRQIRRSGDAFTVDARSGDRIVHQVLSLRDDGSVDETNDSFVVDDVRRISAAGSGGTIDVEVAGPLRVVPIAAEVAATLSLSPPPSA